MSKHFRKDQGRRSRNQDQQTFWEGMPCRARVVRVRVGHAMKPTWWCARLEGQIREAVEITLATSHRIYIDNANGDGWAKVTKGMGSFRWPHKSMPVEEVIEAVRA